MGLRQYDTAHQSFREAVRRDPDQSQIPRGRAGRGARHEEKPSPITEAPGCAGTQIARGIMRRAGWQKGLPCFFMPPHGSAILRAVFRHIRHPVCTILVACQTKGGAACGARGGLFFVECGHVSVRAAAGGQAGGPARAGQGALAASAGLGGALAPVRPGAAVPANPGAGRPALCGGAVLSHARAGSLPARLCIHAGRVADAGRRSAGAHFPWRAPCRSR